MKRGAGGTGSADGGFTLVEVAVVIIIVGVLAAVAVVFVKPRSTAETARGYAHEVAALCDAVRQRAVATRTKQRIEVDGDQVIHRQATEPGLAAIITDNVVIGRTPVPSQVVIAAMDARAHDTSNDAPPAPGTGLPGAIDFEPDGSANAATIFVSDFRFEDRARVAIYPATGSAYVYYEW